MHDDLATGLTTGLSDTTHMAHFLVATSLTDSVLTRCSAPAAYLPRGYDRPRRAEASWTPVSGTAQRDERRFNSERGHGNPRGPRPDASSH